MLTALVEGTTDPGVLADLARGRLRAKLPALRQALTGRFRGHHAFLLTQLLAHLDYLDEALATLSQAIAGHLAPCAEAAARLQSVPGVKARTLAAIIAEIGVDMRRFPQRPGTSRAGPGSARGTTRPGANAAAAACARETGG